MPKLMIKNARLPHNELGDSTGVDYYSSARRGETTTPSHPFLVPYAQL